METRVLRLNPGDDLREALERWMRDSRTPAAFIAAAVGSLARARLRFAGRDFASFLERPLEVAGTATGRPGLESGPGARTPDQPSTTGST